MTQPKAKVLFPVRSRCRAVMHVAETRVCSQRGASLVDNTGKLPTRQRPAPAKYSHIAMSRMALRHPECGEPMRFGFRKVCRRCGAELIMVPRLLHPYHMRVYVKGPRADLRKWHVRAARIGAY